MSASTTSSRKNTGGNLGIWIVLGLSGTLLGVLILVACTLYFGTVSGEEFSPETFDRRMFVYQEIPLLRLQVWPVHRVSVKSSLESHLVANKLVPVSAPANPRWDLVRMTHVAPGSEKCDARILCKYFDSVSETGSPYWLEWTQSHPELAKILWPAVAKLAQDQLYIFVPELFGLARGATAPQPFQEDLQRLLARKYREFAEMQQSLERHEDALKLFDESLAYRPQNGAALRGRAKSYEALDQGDKAAADRLAAARLPDDSSEE